MAITLNQQLTSTAVNAVIARAVVEQVIERTDAVATDWREKLPVFGGKTITLRELKASDAVTLHSMLSTEEVSRFISPPPTTVKGYEQFIDWTHRKREAGELVCFGIVPEGMSDAVGIIQVRSLEGHFQTAEWGFALGAPYWGNGMFIEGALMVLDFVFNDVGVHRLEARSVSYNGRGNGVLNKLGAVQEMRLRQSFLKNGQYYDQYLWSILDEDWKTRELLPRSRVS